MHTRSKTTERVCNCQRIDFGEREWNENDLVSMGNFRAAYYLVLQRLQVVVQRARVAQHEHAVERDEAHAMFADSQRELEAQRLRAVPFDREEWCRATSEREAREVEALAKQQSWSVIAIVMVAVGLIYRHYME